MAPEIFDDNSLRSLIRANNNDHNAIVGAIENIWHGMYVIYNISHQTLKLYYYFSSFLLDIPDQKAVGQDWVTTGTSKPRKVSSDTKQLTIVLIRMKHLLIKMINYPQDNQNRSGNSYRRESGGGRDNGRGNFRDRNVQTYNNNNNYRGNVTAATDGRSNYTKPSPFKKEYSQSSSSSSQYVASHHHSAHNATGVPVADANKPVIVWGQGMSLADRLKRAEAEKELEKVLMMIVQK